MVEMVVVITIILVLSLMSLSAYRSFTHLRRANHSGEMLASTLSAARAYALAQQVPYRVVIQRLAPAGGAPSPAFWIDELDPNASTTEFYPSVSQLTSGVVRSQVTGVVRPPAGVVVSDVVAGTTSTVSAPPDPAYAVVVFSPLGSSTYAAVRLVDLNAPEKARECTVKVYPATGRALVTGGGT